jgi:hypothetical protein
VPEATPGLVHSDGGCKPRSSERLFLDSSLLVYGVATGRGDAVRGIQDGEQAASAKRLQCRRGNDDSPSGEHRVAARTRSHSPLWTTRRLRPVDCVHKGSSWSRPVGEHAALRGEIQGTSWLRLRREMDFALGASAQGDLPTPKLFGAEGRRDAAGLTHPLRWGEGY